MTYSKELGEEINEIIKKTIRPKKRLVITEQTKNMPLKQEANKLIIKFLHWLRDVSRYYKLNRLEKVEMSIEELIQLRLIKGMYHTSHG